METNMEYNFKQYNSLHYKKREGIKVLIFHDSFLTHTYDLYINLFDEVYMVKSNFNQYLIDNINPDLYI